MRKILFSSVVAVLLSGCASTYKPVPLPVSHPAHPAAQEAPTPPPSQALRDDNFLPSLSETASAQNPHAGHSMGHGGH